ncbi:MAG: L-seryl-tRNA(Sec) selenium transferase [Bryobacteraceae bacterium]|nr:L-seryl-tRNA(Sec) selenium transferase [Bryobacteraceae bacterium]
MAPDPAALRQLPAVDDVSTAVATRLPGVPRRVIVVEARRVLAEARQSIQAGGPPPANIEALIVDRLASLVRPSLRRVINATGVILHTNLGRAPLPRCACPEGYSNLEYDLAAGRRGKRDVHIAPLIERLLGAPAIVVNNNAAAVWLSLNELAAGREVIISRGELIEIGDGFRIPEIMARSGAVLREVGTTNRTRIEDYSDAINDRTALLMRVHPSNFHLTGFTGKPDLHELAELAHQRGIPLYEDLGSGCLVNLHPYGVHEPLAADSLAAGVDLVSFSGDKLLGGPQSGFLAGRAEFVDRLRRNPMFRALRLDKLIYATLETTLRAVWLERFDEIPALRMIMAPAQEILERSERFLNAHPGIPGQLIEGQSLIGGGSTPDQSLPTWLIAIEGNAARLDRKLRAASPPVVARIEQDRLLIDLRTVAPDEEGTLAASLLAAVA